MRHQHKMWRSQRTPAVGRHSGGLQDIFYSDRPDLSASDLLIPTQEVGEAESHPGMHQEVCRQNIEAATDPLSGRLGTDAAGRQPVSFSRTLEELRSDGEHLAAHPVNRHDAPAQPRYELAWRGGR